MGAAHTTKTTVKMNSTDSGAEDGHTASSNAGSNARPLSIEAPSNTNDTARTVEPLANQPRQPTSLQGVLRFAMEATEMRETNERENASGASATQFQPMDQEKLKFLRETLASLSGNVIEELQTAIKILSNVVELCPDDDSSPYEAALERIADYVDNLDIANDFYKIGGFAIFGTCLNSPHSSIRWRTADVIAELTQNNPFCQERFLETGLFPVLLRMIDVDPAESARIKALYAVSCIVREHPASLEYMDKNDGYSVLLRAMQSSVKKLQIKSAFLVSSLCSTENNDSLKSTLASMGLVEQAEALLAAAELLPGIR